MSSVSSANLTTYNYVVQNIVREAVSKVSPSEAALVPTYIQEDLSRSGAGVSDIAKRLKAGEPVSDVEFNRLLSALFDIELRLKQEPHSTLSRVKAKHRTSLHLTA